MSEVWNRLLPEGLQWARPWGLLGLLLPLVVLLASLRPALPELRYTGAFALWRDVRDSDGGHRRRLRLPPARVLWILAMVLGSLALASPVPDAAQERQRLRLVVDRSPSMSLPHPEGGTRFEDCIRTLRFWLAEQGAEDGLVLELADGSVLTSVQDLLQLPMDGPGVVDWAPLDREGVLWITDRAPENQPRQAGLVASGGSAVPGAVAARGEARWWWDGDGLAWREEFGPGGELLLVGRVPGVLREFAAAWAEEQGWTVTETERVGEPQGPALALICPPGLPGERQLLQRGGWAAEVRPLAGIPRTGLADARVLVEDLVWGAPGRIELRLGDFGEPRGDLAAFVAEWADWFDGHVASARDVVPLDERQAAGERAWIAPMILESGGENPGSSETPWSARLGLLATVLGASALLLSGLGRSL